MTDNSGRCVLCDRSPLTAAGFVRNGRYICFPCVRFLGGLRLGDSPSTATLDAPKVAHAQSGKEVVQAHS